MIPIATSLEYIVRRTSSPPLRERLVLIPAPPPTYTLSPHLGPLGPGQQAVLDACLDAFTGRLSGVVVTAAGSTETHHVIQLATQAGPLLVIEQVHSERAAPA